MAIRPYSANAFPSRVGVPPPWVTRRTSEARTVPAVKGSGKAEHVGPVRRNEVQVDPVAARYRVQLPVVRGGVDAPEPLIRQPGQAGREPVSEQGEEPENLIRAGSRVGGDHLGALSAVKIEEPIEDVQGIADRSRDDDGTQAGDLVVEVVQPGQAAALAEVAGDSHLR